MRRAIIGIVLLGMVVMASKTPIVRGTTWPRPLPSVNARAKSKDASDGVAYSDLLHQGRVDPESGRTEPFTMNARLHCGRHKSPRPFRHRASERHLWRCSGKQRLFKCCAACIATASTLAADFSPST